jgi:hypothetical protein
MLAQTICLMFAIAFVPLAGFAGDVVYRLDANALTLSDKSKILNLAAIEFQDRIWAAPGIEQATGELEPPKKFVFDGPSRLRIEPAPGSRQFYQHGCTGGPEWLDDTALPRTREMYGLGQSSCHTDWDSMQLFSYGGVTLQR